MITTSNTTTLLVILAFPAPLARMEVSTSQVSCSIVVCTVHFFIFAMFAAKQESLVRRSINANVPLPSWRMSASNVAIELMRATKAFWPFVAVLTPDLGMLRAHIGRFSDDTNCFGRSVLRSNPCHLSI
jgi:hypothetical protein